MKCSTCKQKSRVFVSVDFKILKPEGGWIKKTRLICNSSCLKKCEYCEKSGLPTTITMHEQTSHPERFINIYPHSCDVCLKKFTHSTQLQQHILINHTKPSFNCDNCDLICKRKCDLSIHKLIHLELKPYLKISSKVFQCFNCSSTHTSLYNIAKCIGT